MQIMANKLIFEVFLYIFELNIKLNKCKIYCGHFEDVPKFWKCIEVLNRIFFTQFY